MSVLDRLSSSLNRRDEEPNQELARRLAVQRDEVGIREVAAGLWGKDAPARGDCVNVLFYVGQVDPTLIAPYTGDLLRLLKVKNNRLVWGAMEALTVLGIVQAEELYRQAGQIQAAIEIGSVITVDYGIKTLGLVASTNAERRRGLFPYLLRCLQTCRPKSVAQYAESVLPAVDGENKAQFIQALEIRLEDLTEAQAKRVRKVIQEAAGRR